MDLKTLENRLDQSYQRIGDQKQVVYDLLWYMNLYQELEAVKDSPLYLIKLVVKNVLNLFHEKINLTAFGEPEPTLSKEKIGWSIDYAQSGINKMLSGFLSNHEEKKLLGNFYLHKALLEEHLIEKETEAEKKIRLLKDAYHDRGKSGEVVESFNRVTYAQQRSFQSNLADKLTAFVPEKEKNYWRKKSCQNNLTYVEIMELIRPDAEALAVASIQASKNAFNAFKFSSDKAIKEEFRILATMACEAFKRHYARTQNPKHRGVYQLVENMLKDMKKPKR